MLTKNDVLRVGRYGVALKNAMMYYKAIEILKRIHESEAKA